MTSTERAEAVSRRLPILTFHDISEVRSPVAVAPGAFVDVMAALASQGWRTLSLDELLAGRRDGGWPARTFFLTFDDGFASLGEVAWPILERHGFSATVFVVSNWVGRTNDWPGQPAWIPRRPLLDWKDLTRLRDRGLAVGAHSMSHPAIPDLAPAHQAAEVVHSRRVIEDRLGAPVQMFSYPYGRTSARLEALVGETYQAAFGTRLAFATSTSRPTALERIDAHYVTSSIARGLDSAWTEGYLSLRRLGRGLRGR